MCSYDSLFEIFEQITQHILFLGPSPRKRMQFLAAVESSKRELTEIPYLCRMVGRTFIAIGCERRKVGVPALITTRNKEKNFIVFPLFSLLFLSALSIRKLSLLLHRAGAQNAATQENSNNEQNNRSMGYLIITDQNWQKLRDEILSLADCCHKAFGEKCKHTDWLHNGDVCKLLNISKRTLQHYRDTGVLPFAQIGHKCYYKREDVERLLLTKTDKPKK